MRQKTALIPLLPLALLLPLTACGTQINITNSERLDALLPAASDYPEGFDVEAVDMAEIDGTASTGNDFDSVEPAACEEAMSSSPAEFPEEAAEGAGQVAVNTGSGAPVIYTYVLVSGDFEEEDFDASEYSAMLESCSEMIVTSDGITMEGSIRPADSPDLPEDGGKFTMDLSADGMDMAMWTAWGQVEDVHFVLIGMVMDLSVDASSAEIAAECEDDFVDCPKEYREKLADEARDEAEEEFDALLAVAVQALEEGL